MRIKKCRVGVRLSERDFRKLSAICKVSKTTQTAVIEDLIRVEFEKDKRYSEQFYADLEEKI